MGDLIESALKRLVGKDSGNLIPDMENIDRFDSTITTAPVFYLLILLSKVG